MSKQIFMLCSTFAITMVTANPLLQAFVSQTCPICEQNSLKSQIKNLLLQNIQPYLNPDPQIFFGQNPTSIQAQSAFPIEPNCLCPPPNVQNQHFQIPYEQGIHQPCPPCSQQPQNIPPIPESVNKIFTNPNLRTILDPNTKLFDQTGAEVPRNGLCQTSSPNVVNNYIIIPPEFLLEDKTCISRDDKKMPEAKKVKNNVAVPKSDQKDENSDSSNDNNRKREHSSNNGQRRQRKRQRNRNSGVKIEVVSEKIESSTNQVEAPQPTEEINGNQEKVNINNSNNETDSTTNTDPESNSPAKIISLQQTRNAKKKTDQNTRPFNASKNVGKWKSRSYTPIEKAVIGDFRRKFPNIPEEIVINLLDHMKLQMQNQNLGVPPFYHSQYPFPMNYNQLIGNQFAHKPTTQNKKVTSRAPKTNNANGSTKKRKNRRNKNERTKPIQTNTPETCTTVTKSNHIIAETTTLKNEKETTIVSTTTSTTTEIPPASTEATEPRSTLVTPDVTKDTTIETTTKIITELKVPENNDKVNKQEIEKLELGKEDKLPTILLNELLDEYYPDFTEDRLYLSDEDFSFDVVDEDRYHYTTDKNFQMETLNRERRLDSKSKQNLKHPEKRYILRVNRDKLRSMARQRNVQSNQDVKFFSSYPQRSRSRSKFATENPKVIVNLRNENTKPQEDKKPVYLHEEEKIQFKTPPKLEKIDFETKQINKKYDEDIKSSSYSVIKTPHYDLKSKKANKKPKPIRKDHVETVYARSKVATYGTSPVYFSDEVTAEQDGCTENHNDEYS